MRGTPDSVFGGAKYGFPEGTLKAIAKSGVGGSQYATNPENLSFPLKGVTYVELPSGSSWTTSGSVGTGLIIVHNSAASAGLSNMPSSSFTGLIIADSFNTFKGNITRGVVTLSSTRSTGGNANGSLLYSSAVVKQITKSIFGPTCSLGTDSKIIAWKE